MKYKNAIITILNEYIDYISKEEINILINILKKIELVEDAKLPDEIIIFLNRILDRIWNMYLTDIKGFKNGETFHFLIKDIELFFSSNTNDIKDINDNFFEVIDNSNLENKSSDNCGLVIMPNFTNNLRNEPILPCDFKNKKLEINKLNYIIVGYYCIDTKLDKFDSNMVYVNELSKNNNLPNIKFDKSYYTENIKNDILSIHILFIVDYLLEKKNFEAIKFLKVRDILVSKTKKPFIKYYQLLLNQKITIFDFKKIITDLIDSVDIDKEIEVCYINGVKKRN